MSLKLAVVGHPNKGKSSIVATLSRQSDIAIEARSGTTTHSQSYQVMAAGTCLYELIDTPGFQRPRRALAWLEEQANHAAERADVVADFVKAHTNTDDQTFRDEVELLTPIINGAGIIYVVDGGLPYSPDYEADMEILRWTGQPRMALINPIGANTYIEQWHKALDQYFNQVKVFNPLTASYAQQCEILSAFQSLSREHNDTIEQAIDTLKQQRAKQHHKAASVIADQLQQMLRCQVSAPLATSDLPQSLRQSLKEDFAATIATLEHQCREQLLAIYAHENVQWHEAELQLQQFNLLNQDDWQLWGLDRKRVIGLSIGAGAVAGAAIDVGLGGSSLMTGALAGGLLSGASSLWLSSDAFAIKHTGRRLLGKEKDKQWQLGPVTDPQFAFVLLGRALFYQQAVAGRTHAQQQPLTVDQHSAFEWLNGLDRQAQLQLTYLFKKATKGALSDKHSATLTELIHTLLQQWQQ